VQAGYAAGKDHVFGRRKRDEEAAADAERRAVFEQLAQRPESVCPFLGLASERAGYREGPTGEHRCFAFGDPAPISDDQQRTVCLQRGYSNCPRYLRGVLVIPSEELEALRRPAPPPPPPTTPPPPAQGPAGGGPRRLLIPLLLVILVVAAGGGWYLVTNQGSPIARASDTPHPTATAPATLSPSLEPSTVPTPPPSATVGPSEPATPTPEPTPEPGDRFDHYEVGVAPGVNYTLFTVDTAKGIVSSEVHVFAAYSRAPVVPLSTNGGLVYWQTSEGGFTGLSYIPGQSGPFQLREVFLTPAGERRVLVMTADQATILPTATPSPFH
jgi:hypothetical protein